jgi:hypothetical protein
MDFMERCKAAGEKSVAVRRAAGSAQPPKGVRLTAEGCSKGVRQIPEPDTEQTSNHKPVINNHKQETNSSCDDHVGPEMMTRNGIGYRLTKKILDKLAKAYPCVDIESELNRMSAWLLANANKRKTANGMLRFINAWLNNSVTQIPVSVEEDGPSEDDWLACCAIADQNLANKQRQQETA